MELPVWEANYQQAPEILALASASGQELDEDELYFWIEAKEHVVLAKQIMRTPLPPAPPTSVVCGFIIGLQLSQWAYMTELCVVDPQYQAQGIGKCLLAALRGVLLERNATHLTAIIPIDNTACLALSNDTNQSKHFILSTASLLSSTKQVAS